MQHLKVNPEQNAYQYWLQELQTLKPATRKLYQTFFAKFLEYTNKTPDQLIQEREQETKSPDRRIQRRAETQFKSFLNFTRQLYKPTTQQTIYAAIRSFYEMHYQPLKMRKSDYPKGKPIGVLRATTEATQQIYQDARTPAKALISTANDTGMGVSDLRQLKCNLILENPNAKIIHIRTTRVKTGDNIHTFIGEEAIQAIKNYIQLRKTGTRKTPPETITKDSYLFVTHKKQQPTRECLSNIIAQAFSKHGHKHMSAHSLRKRLQTNLSKAKVPTNWIDLILGHQLINSRDAYEQPTDEELETEYQNAYNQYIRIFPKQPQKPKTSIKELNLNRQQLKQLLIELLQEE